MKKHLSQFLLAAALPFAACATDDSTSTDDHGDESSDQQLTDQLAGGKADGASDVISVRPGLLALNGAPARQLYDLMDSDGAAATTIAGFRILRGPRTACVTEGLDTYCELVGSTDSGAEVGFAAGIHGTGTSAASRYLLRLLRAKTSSTASAVAVPWFQCVQQGGVWCGVEEARELTLTFAQLPPLGDRFVYEGWIIKNGATTTGRFATTPALTQTIPASVLDASAYVLTIEPRRGDAPAASGTHILAGALTGGSGALNTEHAAALGTDFASAAASYVLATPSTAATDDNNLGVWFVIPNGPEALVLPTLPDGWIYEGWVADGVGPALSTGRFRSGMGADSDGAGPTAGPLAGPPRPGQDFISPPRDLIGRKVVITVEPEPDTAVTPFPIRPLIDAEVEAIAAPATQMLQNTHTDRPSGTAAIH